MLFKLRQNFSMRLFYTIGMWLFLIQLVSNTYGFYMDFGFIPIWAQISRVGSLLFTALISYLFYFLRKTAPASMGGGGTTLSPEEINDFLNEEEKPIKKEPKRKIGLRRPCRICGLYFYPSGSGCRMCEDCKEKRKEEKYKKQRENREARRNGEA